MPRTRNNHIQFWLSDTEARDFNRRVRKSGLSREAYLRQIIRGLVPTETPPTDYFQMMNELRRIGVNLNQLATRANVAGTTDAQQLRQVLIQIEGTIRDFTLAVIEPKGGSTWLDAEPADLPATTEPKSKPEPAPQPANYRPWTEAEIRVLEDELAKESRCR
jgi:hypothetical protein